MSQLTNLNVPVKEGGQTTMQTLNLPTLSSLILPVERDGVIQNEEFQLPGGSTPETEQIEVTATTSVQVVTPTTGKLIDSVTINPTPTQEKTVTSSRSAQTVTPDSGKHLSKVTVNALAPTGTYTASSRSNSLDMGATSNYRYVNTNSVPNSNSETYTFASGDTGGTKDLGVTNNYRYVNATNVYNQGKADGSGEVNIAVGVKTSTSTLIGKTVTCKNSSGTVVATKTMPSGGSVIFGLSTAGTYTFSISY